jgi:hypothetical protein
MTMRYQHATTICGTMNQISTARHQSEQGLDQIEAGLVMIARQELHAGATLTPAGDFFSYGLLRIVEIPRWAEVPPVNYIAHQIQLVRLMVAKEIKQGFGLASRRAQVKIGHPDRAI